MPTYDYECEACKKQFEIFHSITETRRKCPECGASRLVRRIGPGSGFLFRGSGFYITDYRNPDYTTKAKAESEGAKPTGGSSGPEKPAAADRAEKSETSHKPAASAKTERREKGPSKASRK